jgi:hypothetical protein
MGVVDDPGKIFRTICGFAPGAVFQLVHFSAMGAVIPLFAIAVNTILR